MKRSLLVVWVSLAAVFPLASAQSGTVVVEPFLGGGLGLSFPETAPAASLQAGADNLLGPLALRGVFDIGFGGFAVGVDVINYFPQTRQLAPYLGVGGKVLLNEQDYGVYGLGGLEYFVDEDVAVFGELQPGYVIDPDDGAFGASIRFGANHHVD